MKKVFIISFCIILFVQAIFGNQPANYNTLSIAFFNSNNSIQSFQQESLEGFLAGTLIKTEDGYIPIEQLRVGDFVSGINKPQQVLNIKQIQIDQIIQLNIDGVPVCVARNQQFFLQAQILKKSCDLLLGDCLSNGNLIKDIQLINEPSICYSLSTEEQSFFLHPNIHVHNFNMVIAGAGGASVLIGSLELLNPVTLIGGLIGLSWYALQYFRSNPCPYEIDEKEYKVSEEELSFVSDVVMQETRKYYDTKKFQLSKLYQDLISLKNNLLLFIKPNYLNSLYFSIGLLSEFQYNFIQNRLPDISYDIRLNLVERLKLIKIREKELEELQQKIWDISLLLGLHFNELIDSKDHIIKYIENIEVETDRSICLWNNNISNIRNDIALSFYNNHLIWQEMLNHLELKLLEFKYISNYYNSIKTHFFVTKITNLEHLINDQSLINNRLCMYIQNSRSLIFQNIIKVEDFLKFKGLLSQQLINQNKIATKQYIISKDFNNIAYFKKKKDAVSGEVNKIFNNDKDKKSGGGGPDKDPEDDDPLPKHNQSIMNHIFRDKKGHMLDTAENQELLKNLVKNPENYLGKDVYLNDWYGKILDNGKQLWAWMRNNTIRNAGLNETPRVFNNRTGLCHGPKS